VKYPTILSSLLAGGLLFGSAFSQADRGTPPTPPAAPAAPAAPPAPPAPKAPKAPKPPKAPKVKITIDGLDSMIESQIEGALGMIGSDSNVPPEVREKLTKKLEKLRGKLKSKFGNGPINPEDLGEIGDEFGAEMEEFGEEMEKWGDKMGKDFEKKYKDGFKFQVNAHDDGDDDDGDDVASADDDDDDDDIDAAVQDLGNLSLQPQQRDQIKRLRADSDAKVAAAKRELDRASEALQKQLANPSASDADISRSIDAVAQQEAAIRKARILAWVNARRILDDSQRKKVEGAAKGKSH
jgi:hypothetical protein